MAWRDQIRPASFKGVEFGVTGDDKEAGRRTVVHEFPQREEVYVEDLGAATNSFTLEAFVLGPDYMDKRDELERVLCEPGPGTLVHPWYGEIQVSQSAPYKVKHAATDGGIAIFTLSFVRDSEPASPASGVNTQVRAMNRSASAGNLVCTVFDAAFDIVDQSLYVVEQAYAAVTGAVELVQAALGGDIGAIAEVLGAATGYDFLPWSSVGQRLWNVYQDIGEFSLSKGGTRADLAAGWLDLAAQNVSRPLTENPGSTRARVAGNDMAVQAFTRHIATVEAAKNLALAVPASRSDAHVLREKFVDVMDALLVDEGGEAPPVGLTQAALPPVLYAALVDMRAASLAALAEAARSTPDVITFTPVAVLPSLVLCHRLSGDIALNADLVARNRLIHPGFVPAQPLEVLTYE